MKNENSGGHMTGAAPTREFGADEIRSALGRVVGSETFSRSERSRDLLQYVIERDLNGEADRLKGFSIALDVFDREDSFDPSTDAVVRVQAGRLRDLLDTYYAGEGKDDRIRISVPRGSYVPAYECLSCVSPPREAAEGDEAATAADEPAGETPADGVRRVASFDMRLVWPAVAFVVLLLCANVWLLVTSEIARVSESRMHAQAEAAAPAPARPAPSLYLPSVTLARGMDEPLRAALEDAIPRFGSVIYRTDKSVTVDEPLSDFYIRAVPSGRNSVHLQLYDRESGILIATDQVPGDLDQDDLEDHVARVASRFLPVGGVIYAFLESEDRLNPLTRCLVLASAYFNNQTEERHAEAYRCHEDLMHQGVNFALVYANLASLAVEVDTDGYGYPFDPDPGEAVRFGRRAVELAPGSAQAYRSLARALQIAGETGPALGFVKQATMLNPYDLGIAASYADTLISAGDFLKATEVMERVTQAAPVHPTWWDFTTFIAAFQVGRMDLVALSSRNLGGHARAHYCAARMIAADMMGDEELREKMLLEITGNRSEFADDPRAFYARFMPSEAADKLVEALRHAGLPEPVRDGG